ncbi:hypothetical protein GUJ93_ZPchr0003g18076 [Zizania palustris]|uniref:Uncharacterized protein n=1 Tax=Zizania palustris TaxID=103762 RepID=A0A8J5VW93_ZIZPA|nr:hypothetical protein GUJ93_ZPchr0003g18076 [Zizania palustris]
MNCSLANLFSVDLEDESVGAQNGEVGTRAIVQRNAEEFVGKVRPAAVEAAHRHQRSTLDPPRDSTQSNASAVVVGRRL